MPQAAVEGMWYASYGTTVNGNCCAVAVPHEGERSALVGHVDELPRQLLHLYGSVVNVIGARTTSLSLV